MLLTVFDIDGTLCRTSGIDDSCWIRTARELFGVEKLSTDWSDYPHSTDESIASSLLGEHLREEPTREHLDRVRDHFIELVRRSHREDPSTIQPTPSDRRKPVKISGSAEGRTSLVTLVQVFIFSTLDTLTKSLSMLATPSVVLISVGQSEHNVTVTAEVRNDFDISPSAA